MKEIDLLVSRGISFLNHSTFNVGSPTGINLHSKWAVCPSGMASMFCNGWVNTGLCLVCGSGTSGLFQGCWASNSRILSIPSGRCESRIMLSRGITLSSIEDTHWPRALIARTEYSPASSGTAWPISKATYPKSNVTWNLEADGSGLPLWKNSILKLASWRGSTWHSKWAVCPS